MGNRRLHAEFRRDMAKFRRGTGRMDTLASVWEYRGCIDCAPGI
jgi:hypothetical protein